MNEAFVQGGFFGIVATAILGVSVLAFGTAAVVGVFAEGRVAKRSSLSLWVS